MKIKPFLESSMSYFSLFDDNHGDDDGDDDLSVFFPG